MFANTSADTAIRVPIVDYRRHPAFQGFPHASAADDALIDACEAEIDHAFARCEANAAEQWAAAIVEFESRFERASSRMLAHIACMPNLAPETRTWLQNALQEGRRLLTEELRLSARQQRSFAKHQWQSSALKQRYLDQGIISMALAEGTSAKWLAASQALQTNLRTRALANPAARQHAAIPEWSSLGRSIISQLKRTGAWALAEEYQGQALEVAFLDLHYSHPAQSWYKNCYQDIDVGTSPYSYLHSDYHSNSQKMLIYFAPVLESNGPFCFLPGSHRWQRSNFGLAMSKALDQSHTKLFGARCPDGYYRPRFRGELERSRFAGLPRAFQVTSHFGDDVLPGSDMASFIEQHEQSYTETDTVVLFNGNRGIHRGGLCTEGERWAVHLGLHAKVPRTPSQILWRQLRRIRAALR